jgi:hypothetical protein
MPGEGTSFPPNMEQPGGALPGQTPAPQVYNPSAQEEMVSGMHPAAQYAYERAVATGAHPSQALELAQGTQNQMIQRATEGQNIEGVQQPVLGLGFQGFVSSEVVKRVQASRH